MVNDTIKRLRELLGAATQMPWRVEDGRDHSPGITARSGEAVVWISYETWEGMPEPADAALIVAAINALPALLDVAEAARRVAACTDITVELNDDSLPVMRAFGAALAALDEVTP